MSHARELFTWEGMIHKECVSDELSVIKRLIGQWNNAYSVHYDKFEALSPAASVKYYMSHTNQ